MAFAVLPSDCKKFIKLFTEAIDYSFLERIVRECRYDIGDPTVFSTKIDVFLKKHPIPQSDPVLKTLLERFYSFMAANLVGTAFSAYHEIQGKSLDSYKEEVEKLQKK